MKHTLSRQGRQRGISLVEMGIAGAVIAMLLVGALMAFQKVQLERQMHQARNQIPSTLSAIARFASTQPSTQSMTTQMLSLAEAWPAELVQNAGQANVRVAGPFPGSTEQVFGTGLTTAPRLRVAWQGFNYWISNIPARACLPMLQLLVTHSSVAMLRVGEASAVVPSANNQAGNTGLVNFGGNGLPSLNLPAATTACSGSGNKQISVLIARQP